MTPFTDKQAVTFSNITTVLKLGDLFFDYWVNSPTMAFQELRPVLMNAKKDGLKNILFHTSILRRF